MHSNKNVSLVIPAHNEEEGLKQLFKTKPQFIDEVIIVDNNSSDNTFSLAKSFGANVIYLSQMGYGLACKTGLVAASGDIICLLDADNSYPIGDVEKIINYMQVGDYDFVNGCRFPLVNKIAMPLIKRVANRSISFLIRKFFNIKLMDSQSGMFVFKKSILLDIISSSPGMEFSQEIKLRAWLNPAVKASEFHINYAPRLGKVKYIL